MPKLIVVSNRLPVSLSTTGELTRSSGGLVSALSSLSTPFLWVGSLGSGGGVDEAAKASLAASGCLAVEIPEKVYEAYYHYANDVLWPQFHYHTPDTPVQELCGDGLQGQRAYLEAAEHFAAAVGSVYEPGDTIWCHDYHLLTLPSLLRARLGPHARLLFFLHTPFPSSSIFGRLGLCEAFLRGLLSCSAVGFHTAGYAAHFLSAAARHVPGAVVTSTTAALPGATACAARGAPPFSTAALVFPIGIDPLPFTASLCAAPAAPSSSAPRLAELQSFFGSGARIVIAVDRLDPIKGLLQRLRGFELLLATRAAAHPRAPLPLMLCVAVPSREAVKDYRVLRAAVEAQTSAINARYGSLGELPPVSLFYRSIGHGELCALLALGRACTITSLRDGMNLVASEYVAVQEAARAEGACPGVLVLSEFAGAACLLPGALLVNPHSPEEVAGALESALYGLPEAEVRARHAANAAIVLRNTSGAWAGAFLAAAPGGDGSAPPPQACSAAARAAGAAAAEAFLAAAGRPRVLVVDAALLVQQEGEGEGQQQQQQQQQPPLAQLLAEAASQVNWLSIILVADEGAAAGEALQRACSGCALLAGVGERGSALRLPLHLTAATTTTTTTTTSTTTTSTHAAPAAPAAPRLASAHASWRRAVRAALQVPLDACPGMRLVEGAASLALHYGECEQSQAACALRSLREALEGLSLGGAGGSRRRASTHGEFQAEEEAAAAAAAGEEVEEEEERWGGAEGLVVEVVQGGSVLVVRQGSAPTLGEALGEALRALAPPAAAAAAASAAASTAPAPAAPAAPTILVLGQGARAQDSLGLLSAELWDCLSEGYGTAVRVAVAGAGAVARGECAEHPWECPAAAGGGEGWQAEGGDAVAATTATTGAAAAAACQRSPSLRGVLARLLQQRA